MEYQGHAIEPDRRTVRTTTKEFLSHSFASQHCVSLSPPLSNALASVAGLQSGLLT